MLYFKLFKLIFYDEIAYIVLNNTYIAKPLLLLKSSKYLLIFTEQNKL